MAGRVVAVFVVMALALLGDSLLYVVLPLHAPALGLSGFQVGVLLSANRWVRMLTNRGATWLAARWGSRRMFGGAALLAGVTTALYALTPAFLPFIIARMAWGFCYSTLRLGCFVTVLAAATDRTRGALMGAYQSISRAGSFVAVIAGGALYDLAGYRTAFLIMASGALLAVPLAFWSAPPAETGGRGRGRSLGIFAGARRAGATVAGAEHGAEQRRAAGRGAGHGPGRMMARPRTAARPHAVGDARIIAVKWSGFALAFAARGVVTATLSLFLKSSIGERFGPGGTIGVATLASWLIGVRWAADLGLATPLGALSDRVGRVRAAIGWELACATAILALSVAWNTIGAVGAAVGLFVAASGLGATLDATAGDLAPPDRRARVMTSYADWTDLGAALGPLLALTLAGRMGLRPAYAAGAAMLGLGAASLWLAFGRRASHAAAVPAERQG